MLTSANCMYETRKFKLSQNTNMNMQQQMATCWTYLETDMQVPENKQQLNMYSCMYVYYVQYTPECTSISCRIDQGMTASLAMSIVMKNNEYNIIEKPHISSILIRSTLS